MKKEENKIVSNKKKLEDSKIKLKNKKLEKILKSKVTYIVSISAILVISLALFLIISYVNSLKYKPYIKFEEKMNIYGFDIMYDNKSAKTNETVTISEALKMILSATFNSYDITNFAQENFDYSNSTWTEYAEACGIIKKDINEKNYSDKVKYIDVITYFEESKKIFLKDYLTKDVNLELNDLGRYSPEEQIAIKDLVAYKIIELKSKQLNGNEYIFKGQLNEIVINFVEQLNTITNSDEKININSEKIPSNAIDYPYTLASVDKPLYEIPLIGKGNNEFYSASNLYKYKKSNYEQVKSFAEGYFDIILNVDYNTITVDSFKEKIDSFLIFGSYDKVVNNYVNYVKENKIIIKGSAKQIVPVFYFDGLSYRIRLKLNFEIKNSNTKENLLYLDASDGLKKTYEKASYEILIDYYLTDAIGAKNIYIQPNEIYGAILNKETSGITKEIDENWYGMEEEE